MSPSPENLEQLEILKSEYNSIYEYLSQGAIVRSRATWYEKGEKSNEYILNLESHKKAKSSVRKVFNKDGFIAQLVEHRTGIAEVTSSNPVEALIFSGFSFPIA